ncbi:ABC transporter permease subunit [Anoxybacillus rupiensis]|uniref:ABC transporter permease n=1 Tax=Anoxybacteroides rupiense TaxID=311460 RepID=UPI001BA72617|nr:ABC transporter permease subunit [Anoxybacillus rupiensis]MBS2771846.1 ABC transporter permease subunit [Anoxybacillus rupiensis]
MNGWIIAKRELKMITRSKWLLSFSLLFTAVAVITVYTGMTSSVSGFSGFSRVTASLLNLSLFLVPLLTLLMGTMFVAGEQEDGHLLLLFTSPISPVSILIGKYIGLSLALSAALSFSYGLVGLFLLILFQQLPGSLFFFFLFSLLLMLMFLSIALLIGFFSPNRFHALGTSLLVWAFYVLFYEFIVMGLISSIAQANWVLPILSASVFLNPVELVRVWSIISLKSGTVLGPSIYDFTVWAEHVYGQVAFIAASILWTILPLFITNQWIKRRNRL